jgi:hypothetical protein
MIKYAKQFCTLQTGVAKTLYNCIQKVLSLSIGWDTNYPYIICLCDFPHSIQYLS